MKLWIRSQDREKLVKCNDIAIQNFIFNEIPIIEKVFCIVGYFDKNTEYEILGKYKTKGRALEVLDEIQARISPKLKTIFTENGLNIEVIDKNYDVYEMPKE